MHQQITSLSTSEITSDSDSDQFKVDKARQQMTELLSQSKSDFDSSESESFSSADSHMRGNESEKQTRSFSSFSSFSQSNDSKEFKATYIKEQKKVVNDVLNFESQKYHKVLVLESKNVTILAFVYSSPSLRLISF